MIYTWSAHQRDKGFEKICFIIREDPNNFDFWVFFWGQSKTPQDVTSRGEHTHHWVLTSLACCWLMVSKTIYRMLQIHAERFIKHRNERCRWPAVTWSKPESLSSAWICRLLEGISAKCFMLNVGVLQVFVKLGDRKTLFFWRRFFTCLRVSEHPAIVETWQLWRSTV